MKKISQAIRYVLSIHILALIILSLLRIVLLISCKHLNSEIDNGIGYLLTALLKGVQFDNVIASAITALPILVVVVLALCNKMPKVLISIFNVYYIILYTLVFAISLIDIPYFKYYFNHIGVSALEWLRFGGDTLGMVTQENSYYLYFIIFIATVILFILFVSYLKKRLFKKEGTDLKKSEYKVYIPLSVVLFGLCFLGIRGGVQRYPIRIGVAYFCNNSFYNQVGINPTFYLIKSFKGESKKYNTLDESFDIQESIRFVQNELQIPLDSVGIEGTSPISRYVKSTGDSIRPNIVIVLMESMSSEFLKHEYKGKPTTPFLRELISKSYYFDNFYSAAIHTNHGIVATLYGVPALFNKPSMSSIPDYYEGLPMNLSRLGYQTLFFVTSNPQYDNMNSSLSSNNIKRIYSLYDYPSDRQVNIFGVPDDFLFSYGIEQLNEASKSKNPFMATFMTVSNHPPFIVPEAFKNAGANEQEQIVAYADNCIKDFMTEAQKQPWYDNTIFIFLGDHGKVVGNQYYNMSLSYNHIPFIIFSPLLKDAPQKFSQLGGQIDVFPTVMGLLDQSYTNNTLGVDLFKTKRPYMFFVSDTQLGCINNDFFYTYDVTSRDESLYDYRNDNPQNLIDQHKTLSDSMKTYSTSMMVVAKYMLDNKLIRQENE